MDIPELPKALLSGGRDYYEKLTSLGLHPEVVVWGYFPRDKIFRLCIVWSGIDRYGPYQLTKRLFAAYRASALPREINPLEIELFSPKNFIGLGIIEMAKEKVPANFWRAQDGDRTDDEGAVVVWSIDWAYHRQKKNVERTKARRDWERFTSRVDQMAA